MVNLVELRRDLHAQPELSFQEKTTAARLQKELETAGYKVTAGIATTGLIAERGEGPVVAIRSDMDALPITELNNVAYRSKNVGVMHACGHDAHMACVVGAAALLAESGTEGIRIIMQPAEEVADHSQRGSLPMIAAGVMKDVQAILGLHVDATMPAGRVGVITQPAHSSVCQFELTCNTESAADLMHGGGILMSKLQKVGDEIKSWKGQLELSELRVRNYPPSRGLLLSGAITYPSVDVVNKGAELLRGVAAQALGTETFELALSMDDQSLARHEEVIETLYQAACSVLGEANVVRVTRRTWAGNFADFTVHAPGAFLLLGAEMRGDRRIQHTASFDVNEDALPVGAQVIAEAARRLSAVRV